VDGYAGPDLEASADCRRVQLQQPVRNYVICSGPHLAVHSFPTRRSSDLLGASHRFRRRGPWSSWVIRPPTWRNPMPWLNDPRRRSEEHTSELQSRSDLVCRLLLEKKNRVAGRDFLDPQLVAAHAGSLPRR